MPTDPAEIVCKNPDCRVSETGKCVEGFSIENCPHVARDSPDLEPLPTAESSSTPKPEDISLPRSERLTLDAASAILRSGQSLVVTILGPTDSGKTSLIASLCNLYQMGQVGRWQFARARTLFAFEQACHDARAASLRSIPQTPHTPVGSGVGFYHLALQNNSASHIVNLLMADRSGEEYRAVADDSSIAESFLEVRRANLITILVNGELLLDFSARHNVKHEVGMILQGLVDGTATNPTQRVALVLTKFDTILRAVKPDRERAEQDFEIIKQRVDKIFGHAFAEIRAFRIAASPSEADCTYGYGVEDLLQYWMMPGQSRPIAPLVLPRGARAMSRFLNVSM